MASEYANMMIEKIEEAVRGMEEYTETLEDLDGLVSNPIYEAKAMLKRAPFSQADIAYIDECLDEADDAAEKYVTELYDSTNCTGALGAACERLAML